MYQLKELIKGKHYEILIEAGRDPLTGKRTRVRRRFRGRKPDAIKYADALLEQVRKGVNLQDKTSVSEYLDDWFKMHQANLAPSTGANYEAILRLYLKPTLGYIKIKELQPEHIERYIEIMFKEYKLQPRSVQQHCSVLSKALKRAVRLKIIPYNPATLIDPPVPKQKNTRALSVEEMINLLDCFKEHRYEILYITAAYTGMRLGELLALRWENIKWPTIYIRQSLSRIHGQNYFKTPKSNKTRGIVCPDIVINAIESIRSGKEEGLIFCHEDGTPLNPSVVSRNFINKAKEQGLDMRFHDLRHSHATQLFAMGIHPNIVKERLGHHDVSFSLNRYTHAVEGMQDSVVEKYNLLTPGTKKAQNSNSDKNKMAEKPME